jgi:AcrR family transcriptional regulator
MRMSAERRRGLVLDAARLEFAQRGYEATTTEAIARRVGVSQPYLFRLFPSKKAIFLASVEVCFDLLERMFEESSAGLAGEEALTAIGTAYNALLDDRAMLQLQLQMWSAACGDDDVRELARSRLARLWRYVDRVSGADPVRVMQFMSHGMLLNVFAALELPRVKEQLGESLMGLATDIRGTGPVGAPPSAN